MECFTGSIVGALGSTTLGTIALLGYKEYFTQENLLDTILNVLCNIVTNGIFSAIIILIAVICSYIGAYIEEKLRKRWAGFRMQLKQE